MAGGEVVLDGELGVAMELTGTVKVGPASAARLGVPVGTEVDLGRLAYQHSDPARHAAGQAEIKPNPFNSVKEV